MLYVSSDDNGLSLSGLKKSPLLNLLTLHTATAQCLIDDVVDDDLEDDGIVLTEHNADVIASCSVSMHQPPIAAAGAVADSNNDINLLISQQKVQIAQIEQTTQLSQSSKKPNGRESESENVPSIKEIKIFSIM
jgi:hypothetical protein